MTDLRYPIGQFEHAGPVTENDLERWFADLEALPEQMRSAVTGLSDAQLDTPYRPGGWTIRQVVHHMPDSHLNSYIRFKWALTEDEPTIKAYDEARWAELPDSRLPIGPSLMFLDIIHTKLLLLLRNVSREQLERRFVHPASGSTELAWNVGMYAWHGRHHLAQITGLLEREDWRTL